MFVVDPIVEQSINDPMLIDNLQDTESDLENMNSIRQNHDFMDQSEFERNVEGWEENSEFNLFDFIGDEDGEPGSSLADDPKDQVYKNWAYNQQAFGGNADYSLFQSTYQNTMGRAPPNANQHNNATVPNTYEPNNSYYDQYGSTSSASIGSTPPKMNGLAAGTFLPVVKREPAYYEEESYLDDEYSRPSAAVSAASSLIDPALVEQHVNQITKKPPRKYRMKSDNEKVNPVYKIKRTKNNDAVRRSREKAKVIQLQKEQRLQNLETDIRTLWDYHLKTLEYMKQNCQCGIALPKPPKIASLER